MMGSIAAATAVAVFIMFAGRCGIMHGKEAPKGSARRLLSLTIGHCFDTLAFIVLVIIACFLLMSI